MGSEVDAEAATASAVDSDGSVSWEDFFGTSTDLVPQLLGVFDELARRGNGYGEHVVLPSSCSIPAALQKRLSLVQHSQRNSMLGQLCTTAENMKLRQDAAANSLMPKSDCPAETAKEAAVPEVALCIDEQEKSSAVDLDVRVTNASDDREPDTYDEKAASYRRETTGLTPLRYNRRCRAAGRPLSGSSIASSTSSSGCSNQGNACTANPYLASVESLADTCASSQGSGDSGVVTVSETSCRIGNDANVQRRDSGVGDSMFLGPRYCDPHRNSVEKVLLEIVDTEAIYVEHLRQIIQGYLIFWRDDPTFLHQLRLNDLFGNIEDIFEFNREFLKEIEECGLDPIRVANTFIKHNGGFKVYTEYCTNYPRTVSVLTDLMSEEETACAFQERQAALGHALPLGAYLLTPVQRILKYRLLLEKLSKKYGADCESRENDAEGLTAIEGALAAMADIANHINAMKRKHEHAVRVQEIQSLLYGWPGPDLTTCGELVAEGSFRMRGAKAPRHVFLFDRMLLLTKKKEDSLLVYKAHIMCSNLMLIESIPGEPLSFHVIPFDNPRLQYTLQARNLEQKREWTLQIKRVILENYNAVIPSHARNLVLQLGQTQSEDDIDRASTKKQYSAPPEYLEKRKQERQRRRSEIGLKQKLKKGVRKSENGATTDDSPGASRKTEKDDSNTPDAQEQPLNRSSEGRASKVKDRFTNWRRKSEPGFQSYVSLNNSDEEQKDDAVEIESPTVETECPDHPLESEKSVSNSHPVEAKENNNEQQTQARTVEEIVGHILMENQEFQKLLEKQRTNSIINVRQQQRFNKHVAANTETSDESDSENTNYVNGSSNNNRCNRVRTTSREQRLIKTNNTWNTLSSPPARDNQPTLQLLYNNLKTNNNNKSQQSNDTTANNKVNRVQEKKALFEAFKRQSIVTESKIIKTALRIRENSTSGNEDCVANANSKDVGHLEEEKIINTENRNEKAREADETKGFGNYDNLQHVWEGLHEARDADGNDSPTRPAVWLNKLCEGLPTSPQKCGSLPRSFQISPPNSQPNVTKTRFLQRDGKPMSERPFTIASDKPAEINLEDMERYASSCQPEGRIAKFPTSVSASSSTFFCSLEDTYSEVNASPSTTNIHPEHKIYRANGNAVFRNVLSKAGSRLRNTLSTETLECKEEYERTKYFRSLNGNGGKAKRKCKGKLSRETSSDVEEIVGCVAAGTPNFPMPSLYYKQGSSGLGARIAQSDYADPSILFTENKRNAVISSDQAELIATAEEPESPTENGESETDSFYERSFETIENYVDGDTDDVFRDSAIFSDIDEVLVITRSQSNSTTTGLTSSKAKVAPAVPSRKKSESVSSSHVTQDSPKCKPSVARKPSYLKTKPTVSRQDETKTVITSTTLAREMLYERSKSNSTSQNQEERFNDEDKDDVSAGQSQAGWVRKIVGQLQGQIET